MIKVKAFAPSVLKKIMAEYYPQYFKGGFVGIILVDWWRRKIC